jgi:RNA polymerase sigma-70 factor (ECF subfamily)
LNATPNHADIDRLFRSASAQAVASLARAFNDFEQAEDAVQDAYLQALQYWSSHDVPAHPAAWIYRTARNAAIDRLRREKTAAAKYALLAKLESLPGADETLEEVWMDDRLAMIFTACHPALSDETRTALTLRFAAGLSVAEIASGLLCAPATIAQRLVRAKRKIREAHIPFTVPAPAQLPDRLSDVLRVLYLIFNEGYASSTHAQRVRTDLCDEALRLVRLVDELMPGEPEIAGLHALILFHDARRDTRIDEFGDLVLLQDQDRTKWDARKILRGITILDGALRHKNLGTYQIEAALASEHARAATWEETNWFAIREWYDRLMEIAPSPVVALNRAVAIAYTDGNAAGLSAMDDAARSGELADYPSLYVARAELLRRLGRIADAKAQYARANELTQSDAERRHIEKHAQNLQ